jgi:hypothetical protein
MAKTTYPRISDLGDLEFHQCPQDAGQIVDYDYATDETYLYTRCHDRSDNSVTITRQEFAEDADETDLQFEPWNGVLPQTQGDEEQVYADELADMMELLDSHGERFSGNHVADVAQDWLDNGFDAESAGEWCEIGAWDASTAAQLRDAGLTPDQANDAAEKMCEGLEDTAAVFTDGDPIYAACNCDINVSRIVEAAKS